MKNTLQTRICNVRMKNPTILNSGYLGVNSDALIRVATMGAGAVTSKSCGLTARTGHPNPTVIQFGDVIINAVGLSNPGVEEELREIRKAVAGAGVPVIASVFEESTEAFASVAEKISEAGPALIELNISCPNVQGEMGKPFACDTGSAAQVVEKVKEAVDIPLIVKLSPNVTDIVSIAESVEGAGADAICAINTVGPGMLIDIDSRKPVLANKVGGISGPAIRPIAVRCVWEISNAVDIPVIGTGGIITGRDAVEMLMAGATAVGIGSSIHYRGMEAFNQICDEIDAFMKENGYSKLEQLRLDD
ncbi:MAG: dihydroorotate dehydrogenase [Candidatus Micrarchaeota archaeon]